jgi:tetratricopeptide (TPR) repeat protein
MCLHRRNANCSNILYWTRVAVFCGIGLVIAFAIVYMLLSDYVINAILKKSYSIDYNYFIQESQVRDCINTGQYDEALAAANLLVEQFENQPFFKDDVYHLRAIVHAHRNDLQSAIADVTSTIALTSPRDYFSIRECTITRGRCYENAGMLDAAAKDYQEAYDMALFDYAAEKSKNPNFPRNYMDVIDDFGDARKRTDEEFGFDQIKYDRQGSRRDIKRTRREAILSWLIKYVDVHPIIVANISDVDAKVYSLPSNK